jgi:predicted CxxxxCH...CXXCH cytochrome family protein
MKRHCSIIALLALAFLSFSCSDLKNDLPTATSPGLQLHGQGWIDKTSVNFHGTAIEANGWDLAGCKQCHGPNYSGGTSQSSCLTCHNKQGGPENCTVCHGSTNAAPPRDLSGNTAASYAGVGTHQSHLSVPDSLGPAVRCSECHTVPAALTSAGHIDTTAGAEVQFAGSVVTSSLAAFAGPGVPTYSRSTMKCDNIYCHGYFPNGNKVSPVWNDTTGQYHACGSCHGDPTKSGIGNQALPKTLANGGTHPNDIQCSKCHYASIDVNYKLLGSLHINGKID